MSAPRDESNTHVDCSSGSVPSGPVHTSPGQQANPVRPQHVLLPVLHVRPPPGTPFHHVLQSWSVLQAGTQPPLEKPIVRSHVSAGFKQSEGLTQPWRQMPTQKSPFSQGTLGE
jgi:hypothetical protein